MDILILNYERLCDTEAAIRLELSRVRDQFMKPTVEVSNWLQNVERVHNQVDCIKRSVQENSTRCFSCCYWRFKLFGLVNEVTVVVIRLQRDSPSADALVVLDESQFHPLASTLMTLVGASAQRSLRKIWGSLMNPTVGILGIYGLGGVGKTTIMMNIKNPLATSKTFDKVVWVTVSKELSLSKIQNEIALQLNMDNNENIADQAAMLLGRLKKIKRFLIIFDDLWDEIPLKEVGIPRPNGENRCKIVVISRLIEICTKMGSHEIIRVEVLQPEEAWDLFVSKAGNIALTLDIQPFARRVARKCCGVPIVIISVGLALRDEVSVKAWRKAMVELSTPLANRHDIVLGLLRYSYNRLRNDTLQKCFLYCAFFHEDYLFKPDELIRYWMAEGFTYEGKDFATEIDDGFKILKALLDANMLEIFTKSGDDWIKMHDLFRDLAIKIMNVENEFWVYTGLGLFELPFDNQWAVVRKISLMSNQIYRLDVAPTKCLNLSTLLLHDNPITHIRSAFFSQMPGLKFLDLSYSLITELPPSLSELAQLRVLFLHYCKNLWKMPSLEKMKQLQVLRLCGTLITELPQGMEGLISLRSLDLSNTTKLDNIRLGAISSLSGLEELRMQGSGLCKMDTPMVANYLKEMRCLKRLAILTISTVGYEDLLDTIMCLQEQNLKTFSINVYGSSEDYNEDV